MKKIAFALLIMIAACAVDTSSVDVSAARQDVMATGHVPETTSERAMVSRLEVALDLAAGTNDIPDACKPYSDPELTVCCYSDGLSWCCCVASDSAHRCRCGTEPLPPRDTDPSHGSPSDP